MLYQEGKALHENQFARSIFLMSYLTQKELKFISLPERENGTSSLCSQISTVNI